MKNLITTALLVSSGVFIAGQTNASTKAADATFQVKIEVVSTCAISATDIDFDQVNSGVTATDKTGNLNVTCTSQTPYRVGLSGSGKMTNTADSNSSVAYQLFKASSDTAEWNNDNNQYSATGSGTVQAIPVVAKLSGSTNVRAGNYADTVTATVTY
ncbi:spore coat protein U domain-containing protein [Acinetobacter sp. NIPH 2377]|jgi:spore coat protein U-like protein|uniref:Csu type fimbrial protein n=1 Tax=Acinetobacter terrestris TaxID=2529843 RepID=UPI0014908341|nr:spore coat U domain-containing protein [Acinetobacter terrestris]NNH37000.1 spore coat protein U domain-containing protein [Acinetobacter terrestris]